MPDKKVEVPEVEGSEAVVDEAAALAAQKEGYDEGAVIPPSDAKTAKAADSKPDKAKQSESEATSKAGEADAKAKAEAEAKAAQEAEKAEQEAERARLKALGFYTQADVDELMKKHSIENSRVFGKFGSIEQRINALATEAKATGVEVTAEDVADLRTTFGDELADSMLKTMNRVLSRGRIGGNAEPAKEAAVAKDLAALQAEYEGKLTKATEATKTELTREFERRTLAITHEDWKEVTGVYDAQGKWLGYQPAFEAWMNTLPVDDQEKLRDGWDALFVSKKLTEYKGHVKAQAEAAAKAVVAQVKPAPKGVPSRIRQAVVTDGGATPTGSTLTDKDYQRMGYNEA